VFEYLECWSGTVNDELPRDGRQQGVGSHGRCAECVERLDARHANDETDVDADEQESIGVQRARETIERLEDIAAAGYRVHFTWSCTFKRLYADNEEIEKCIRASHFHYGMCYLGNTPTEANILQAVEEDRLHGEQKRACVHS